MTLKIIADENIPLALEAFGTLGEVTLLPGRRMTPESLANADMLMVRSITRVNEQLLNGAKVQFVGTATIGVDHVDEAYLLEAGVGFASAPGCNSTSVAEYVTAAMLTWAERRGAQLADCTLGVVGVGHVGTKVVAKARALGMKVLCCDPPRKRVEGLDDFLSLADLLERQPDVLTFHVPLSRDGDDATFHMINHDLLARVRDNEPLLINSSRGPIHDTAALLARLDSPWPIDLVLDTWENEPNIDQPLLDGAMLATPHIAGYSLDGKVTGTKMIYDAACHHLGVVPAWEIPDDLPAPRHPIIEIETADADDQAIIRQAVRHAYDIEWDDTSMREMQEHPADGRGKFFDDLRKNYPTRREFPAGRIRLAGDRPGAAATLEKLGFRVAN